jgi:hypothetical protein
MSIDPAIETVRAARRKISQECENDPRRVIEHYVELQKRFCGRLIHGPEESEDADQEGAAPDRSGSLASGSRR